MFTTEYHSLHTLSHLYNRTLFIPLLELASACSADGIAEENDVGDQITLGGCETTIALNDQSGLSRESLIVNTFWKQVCVFFISTV